MGFPTDHAKSLDYCAFGWHIIELERLEEFLDLTFDYRDPFLRSVSPTAESFFRPDIAPLRRPCLLRLSTQPQERAPQDS